MPPWMQIKSEEGKKVIRKIFFITTSISLRPLDNKRFEKYRCQIPREIFLSGQVTSSLFFPKAGPFLFDSNS